MRSATLLIAVLALCGACDESDPSPGEEGGECRVGLEPCSAGLACVDGACRVAPDAEVAPSLTVEFFLEKETVLADGTDRMTYDFTVTEGPNDAPFEGDLVVYLEPPTAGRVEPSRQTIRQGIGVGEFIPCDRNFDFDCPDYAVLRVARPDQLFDPVGESPRITLADDDRPTYTTSRVRPEDCASPGGKLGFRPDQFAQMESIVSIDAATLQIDPAVTRLNAGQGATTLSIAVPEGVSTGQRMLQGGEMRFHIDPAFMMASPCDRAEYDGWAGTLDVLAFDADETGVQTMRLFYSLTCAGTGGRTAQATGCLHYQAPME